MCRGSVKDAIGRDAWCAALLEALPAAAAAAAVAPVAIWDEWPVLLAARPTDMPGSTTTRLGS